MQDTKETVTFRGGEEARKRVADKHQMDTLQHIEKKLIDKGVHRKDRRPVDGIAPDRQPKSGHGGKYTWEGPASVVANELEEAPAVLDENDPNYVDDETDVDPKLQANV